MDKTPNDKRSKPARILIIAGSDPSGGAGIQADIKTVTALGGYAMAALTSLTVQNTRGVTGVHPTPPKVIRDQIIACLDDIGADAIKIGMIGDEAAGKAILSALDSHGGDIPLIVDPVLVATSGDALATDGMAEILIRDFAPRATVITPNAPEAKALTGAEITSTAQLLDAGRLLLKAGAKAALVKGGHLQGAEIIDVLVDQAGALKFPAPRIESTSTHGTGCTLASALATGVGQGLAVREATARAIAFVREAIRTAPGFGSGHGPLNHMHTIHDAF
jgi:hydroxymethylpyrimidine/phosphomethylpyrimidine kinase